MPLSLSLCLCLSLSTRTYSPPSPPGAHTRAPVHHVQAHKQEADEDDFKFHAYERTYGKFERLFPLPDNADADAIKVGSGASSTLAS